MIHSTFFRVWNIIQQRLMRLPSFVAENAFLFTLLLVGVAGLFSLFLFYAYGFSGKTQDRERETSRYDVKEELFSDTVGELEKRRQNLEDASEEVSKDIFNATVLTEE
jgi:hypothetical protein